jgi:integrase
MSIRKRTWKTAKGEAREAWVVDYVDQAGKRRLKTFKKKKEADAFETRSRFEITQGTHTPDSASITVAEAAEKWLETCHANGLEPATIDAYEQHARLHIKPFLGQEKLSRLTATMVREFEDKLRRGNQALGIEPRSPAMVKRIITSLSTLIGDAEERGLVARNVVRDLRSRRKRGKQKRHEDRHNGKLKIRAFVGALQGRYRPILLTAAFTGLRASELRGLRWSDVDLDKRQLHVRQRVDKRNIVGPPKTSAGERNVPLPPIVVNTLKEHRLVSKNRGGLVFPSGTGRPEYHVNIVNRGLIPAWVAAGIVGAGGNAKYRGMHALRHFYASWCINRKVDGGLELPAKTVQERLGHSTISMTMDTYSHLFPQGDPQTEFAAAEKALLG